MNRAGVCPGRLCDHRSRARGLSGYFALYATTSPAANCDLGRSELRFSCTHSSATLLLSSALSYQLAIREHYGHT